MSDRGPEPLDPRDGPRDRDAPAPRWTDHDLSLEEAARQLLSRLYRDDDAAAAPELVMLLAERVSELEILALDAVGLCVGCDLADEFLAELVVSLDGEVPAHPLKHAVEAMTARARAVVNALAAQPLPWEGGYEQRLPASWLARFGLESRDQGLTYVTLVALHRLPLDVRWVMRDMSVNGKTADETAAQRMLPLDEVQRLHKRGRVEVFEATERYLGGGDDD